MMNRRSFLQLFATIGAASTLPKPLFGFGDAVADTQKLGKHFHVVTLRGQHMADKYPALPVELHEWRSPLTFTVNGNVDAGVPDLWWVEGLNNVEVELSIPLVVPAGGDYTASYFEACQKLRVEFARRTQALLDLATDEGARVGLQVVGLETQATNPVYVTDSVGTVTANDTARRFSAETGYPALKPSHNSHYRAAWNIAFSEWATRTGLYDDQEVVATEYVQNVIFRHQVHHVHFDRPTANRLSGHPVYSTTGEYPISLPPDTDPDHLIQLNTKWKGYGILARG